MSVIVEGLTKKFGDQIAVNNISFSLNKGEITGFLGPNGAGKSTTMKMITGYLLPDSGRISVCGIENNLLEIKKKIGYLPESNALYYDMYVKEYLHFLCGIHKIKNATKKVDEVVELTGLVKEKSKKINQLSKGYKQRVGIAAALINDPEVLILDEPTSGLDPNQIIEIRNVIKEQSTNKVVLFSTHILQEVESICKQVIIINNGIIVANNSLQNLQNVQQNSSFVQVQFQEKIPSENISSLKEVLHVDSINSNFYTIQTNSPDIVKKQLLEMALLQNLNIVSLQTNTSSLEEIFKSLTKK